MLIKWISRVRFINIINCIIVRQEVEKEIQHWIDAFLSEVDRIESFFKSNLKQLKKEFYKLEE